VLTLSYNLNCAYNNNVSTVLFTDTSYLQFLAKCKDGKGGIKLMELDLHAIYLSKLKNLII
jgi:hypothetical protein